MWMTVPRAQAVCTRENGLAVPRGSGLASTWRRKSEADELGGKEEALQAGAKHGQRDASQSCLVSERAWVAPTCDGAAGRSQLRLYAALIPC